MKKEKKNRKLTGLFLTLLITFCSLLVACPNQFVIALIGPKNKACNHDYVWEAGSPSTCTAAGTLSVETCSKCGDVVITPDPSDPATGHNYELDSTVPPNCTEEGYDIYECSRCFDTEQRDFVDIVPDGHIPGAAATCTEDQICTVCEDVLDEAAGHIVGTPATCTAAATCDVCGESYGSLGDHNWKTEFSKNDEKHWYDCHNCTGKNGESSHTSSGAATCLASETCTVCSHVIASAKGHDRSETVWTQDGANGHYRACSRCSDKGTVTAHSGPAATCTTAQTCTACSYTMASALNHDRSTTVWTQDGANGHYRACSRCSDKGTVTAHSGAEATCTTAQICTACGFTINPINNNNHNFGPSPICATTQCLNGCNTIYRSGGHIWGNWTELVWGME